MSRLFVIKPMVLALGVAFSGSIYAMETASVWEHSSLQCRNDVKNDVATLAPAQGSGGEKLPENTTRITANQVDGQTNVRAKAEGDVIVERDGEVLNAQWAEYDQAKDVVRAGDQFTLTRADGQTVSGKNLEYDLASGKGKAQGSEFAAEQNGRRLQGISEEVELQDKQHYAMKGVKFNTCNPGDTSWYIQAAELTANKDSGIGVAKHAKLVFGGVPVLYTPWADFPLNGNRKSGFLVPSVSIGSNGTELEVPYYFNLAPNYDATITPGIISSRGATLAGEARYLMPKYSGSLTAKYMPDDRKSSHNNRYEAHFIHLHKFSSKLQGGIDYHRVSDDDYYRDFYGRNDVAVNVNLLQKQWLKYKNDLLGQPLEVELLAQRYQTLSDYYGNKDKPYAILPRLQAKWQKNIGITQFNIFGQFTRFAHDDKQSGNRLVAYPSVQWDFRNRWGYVRPKIGVHATQYWLNEFQDAPIRRYSRVLPIANVDAGMTFEREFSKFGKQFIQTLEPRLFYNYIPSKSQNNLPNFDSSDNAFGYEQLFRENLYSGHDRINASNSLATGLQTRLLSRTTGEEFFRAGFGQKFYFTDDNVLLNGNIDTTPRRRSDFVVFGGGRIAPNWYADAMWHYNQNINQTQRFDAGVRYNPEAGKVVSIRMKYGRSEEIYTGFYGKLKHIDVAAQWPISANVYAVGRLNYSLSPGTWLEQTAGFEYRSPCGCWSASVVGQRYVNGLNSHKNAVFFTLQLKNLSNLGKDPYEQLRLGIPGYTKTNEVIKR